MKENTKVEIFASKSAPDGKMCGLWANMNDGLIYMFNGTRWVKAVNVTGEMNQLRSELQKEIPPFNTGSVLLINSDENDILNIMSYISVMGNLKGANLEGADLSGQFLPFVDMSDSSMYQIYAVNCALTDTVMINADLRVADLSGADMTNANLAGANLEEAKFVSTGVTNVNFVNNKLNGADFTNADGFLGAMGQNPAIEDNIISPNVSNGDEITWVDGLKYTWDNGLWILSSDTTDPGEG